jgi:beta-lactamase regulating signal transducer with metallopeptidase domain
MIGRATDALVYASLVPELSLLAKATLVLGAGLVAARLAGRSRASIRHLLLAATFAAVLLLPVVAMTAPEIEVPIVTVSARLDVSAVSAPAGSGGSATARGEGGGIGTLPFAWRHWAGRGVWAAGSLLFAAPLAIVLWRLGRLRLTGLPWPDLRDDVGSLAADAGVTRTVDVVLHEAAPSPITFGTRHPVIVLPLDAREWPEADLRRALVHELEHVRRGDWALQTAARAVCALWWFHPLVWVAWRWLSLEAERACDDAVVEKEEGMEYAEQLVSLARRLSATHAQPTLGMANRSDLSARVASLLDASQRRGRAGLAAVAAAAGTAATVALAVAPVRAVAFVPAPEPVVSADASDQDRGRSRLQRGLDTALYEAAEAGDIAGINELVAAGANVNAAIDGDGSPLIAAAREGRLDAARLLIDKGADPDVGVEGDGSPLIAAAASGRTEMASLLLDRGASIDLVVPGDENPLIQASTEGHLAVVQLLVARGADINARVQVRDYRGNDEWRTPLGMARRGGHRAVVAFLLSAGARD